MKKYIKPIATVVNVEAEQLICDSISLSSEGTSASGITEADAQERFDEVFDADWNF